jgi:Family of unknown function (DUF6286)
MTAVPGTTTPGFPSTPVSAARPAAGRPPSALPAAAPAGVLLAFVLLGLGVVALRDTAVALQWLPGTPWIDAMMHRIDGLRFTWTMIPAGLAALVVGMALVFAALRPSRKTALPVTAASSIWISPWELAAVASYAANSVPGVFDARTAATRRILTISARVVDSETAEAKIADIVAAVHAATAIVAASPKVTVTIRKGTTP